MDAPIYHERVREAAARRENVEVPFAWIMPSGHDRVHWRVGDLVGVGGVVGVVWLVDNDEKCLGVDFGENAASTNSPVAWRHPDIEARRRAWIDARWWDAEHSCWRLKDAS